MIRTIVCREVNGMSEFSTAADETIPDRGSSSAVAAKATAFVLALLAGYVLSPGPGLWILEKIGWSIFDERWRWVVLPWAPLDWAAGHIPALEAFYQWYMPFWGF
jgi:hypothetical protein